jgi:hypothetical protein
MGMYGWIFYPRGGAYFLFAGQPVTRAAEVSQFFAAAPRDTGIMLSGHAFYLQTPGKVSAGPPAA